MKNDAFNYAVEQRQRFLEELCAFLRIPSISALPDYAGEVRRAAEWVASHLKELGLDNVELDATAGHPLVYGEWLKHPGAPTLLIYGHYDVQPPDPIEEWQSPPFEPEVRGENLYARGASDDKGQLFIQMAAVASLLRTRNDLPLNVKFLIEGEEEVSSRNLQTLISAKKDLLRADTALISDSEFLSPDQPSIDSSVRGIAYLEFELIGFDRDLHSGVYGGVVDNPLNAMVKILAALKDDDGRITIPGFYDDVLPLTAEEKAAMAATPIDEAEFKSRIGASALFGEKDYSIAERAGGRPTLEIHGIRGGFIGEGPKTVIPAKASAKVSMRLVSDQEPDKIAQLFEEYVRRLLPPTMKINFHRLGGAYPAIIDIHHPAMAKAKEAYKRGFGKEAIFVRQGGTLPIVPMLQKTLGLPVVMMGFGLPDDNLHAPNEKLSLPNFYRGIETAIHYMELLAQG